MFVRERRAFRAGLRVARAVRGMGGGEESPVKSTKPLESIWGRAVGGSGCELNVEAE